MTYLSANVIAFFSYALHEISARKQRNKAMAVLRATAHEQKISQSQLIVRC